MILKRNVSQLLMDISPLEFILKKPSVKNAFARIFFSQSLSQLIQAAAVIDVLVPVSRVIDVCT